MTERRYRVTKMPFRGNFSGLENMVFAEVPVLSDPGEHCRTGEWYCHNPKCSIRQVRLHIKKTAPTPGTMHCPACARPLRFVEWLRSVPITPCECAGRAPAHSTLSETSRM